MANKSSAGRSGSGGQSDPHRRPSSQNRRLSENRVAIALAWFAIIASIAVIAGVAFATFGQNQIPVTESSETSELPVEDVAAEDNSVPGQESNGVSSESTKDEEEATATDERASDASEQAGSSNEASTAESGSAESVAQKDLSWRDADFAVDPNRTDWNYESNGRKVVYLTIDDGPSDKTQAVLDILDKYGCKATFFVVGQDPAYYHMIKEAYDRGHTIGLHSLTHDYAYIYSSQQAYFDDLNGIGAIVRDQIGFVPCFIRFPGGSSNAVSANYSQGIMTALTGEVQAYGYQYYDWNVSSGDGSEHTADELVFFATEDAPDYDNIVMLMHDSTYKQASVEALSRIIEYYQARGYTFEAIDRTTMVPHHATSN